MENLFVVIYGSLATGLQGHLAVGQDVAASAVKTMRKEHAVVDSLPLIVPNEPGRPQQDVQGKYVVLTGNLVQGHKAYGPFASEDDADEYGEDIPADVLSDRTYGVLTLR